jgi:hypothetical protein
MSHPTEEFCCHSITRLPIELAMQTVHQQGVRILTFAGAHKLLIVAHLVSQILPTRSENARSAFVHEVLLWIGTGHSKESPP